MKNFKPSKIILRTLVIILIIILCLISFLLCTIATVFNGPSDTMRNMLVSSFMETSALKFIPRMFFTEEEIDLITNSNTEALNEYILTLDEIDIVIPQKNDLDSPSADSSDGITFEDVYGETYCGKMMIIDDPSRVSIKIVDTISETGKGLMLSEIANEDGVIAAFNGGGFMDINGMGNGGMPIGVTIRDGELLCDYTWEAPTTIGFDKDHKLIVGNISGKSALDLGIVQAASFGPLLIKNGVVAPLSGSGGLNPRTAIGQRADGAILVLVIDGRQPHSLGASYADLAEIMEQYKAVNAANLDGGSSSMLFYEGKLVNSLGSAVGERRIPTVFVVE